MKKPTRNDYRRIEGKNSAGATAFLEYFVDGYRYGLLTGDASPIRDLSDPDCKPCQEMIAFIESGAGRLRSASWVTEKTSVRMLDSHTAQGATRVRSTAELIDDEEPGTEIVYIGAQMRWSDGKWMVYNISVEGEK